MKPLQISGDIVPVDELETGAAHLLRRLSDRRRPIVITQDGKPAAVLIGPDEFDRIREQELFVAAVHEGLADAEAGRLIEDEALSAELEADD